MHAFAFITAKCYNVHGLLFIRFIMSNIHLGKYESYTFVMEYCRSVIKGLFILHCNFVVLAQYTLM